MRRHNKSNNRGNTNSNTIKSVSQWHYIEHNILQHNKHKSLLLEMKDGKWVSLKKNKKSEVMAKKAASSFLISPEVKQETNQAAE